MTAARQSIVVCMCRLFQGCPQGVKQGRFVLVGGGVFVLRLVGDGGVFVLKVVGDGIFVLLSELFWLP